MSAADGALHHIFFFLKTAPSDHHHSAVTSPQTSHTIIESESLDGDGQQVATPPHSEYEGAESIVKHPGNVSGEPDQSPTKPSSGSIAAVTLDRFCTAVTPSIIIAGLSTNVGDKRVDTSSVYDDQSNAQGLELLGLSPINTATANTPSQVQHCTSSPSKTTPLSVSAPEFVPLELALPPAPAITTAAAETVPPVHVHSGAAALAGGQRYRKTKAMGIVPVGPYFEQRKTAEKGVGLYATKKIPVGTRIISEDPLLRIRNHDITLVLKAYHKLSLHKKTIYDNLHAYTPKSLNLEQEILLKVGVIDDDKMLANNVKVMSIFSANDFLLANQKSLGIFETASRINHSCIPNVHFSNNAELGGKETVHAARDIQEGEELLANYIGGRANYQPAEQRRKYLHEHYGFVCHCDACSGALPGSDARRLTLQYIVWGLNEWKYQEDGVIRKSYIGNPYFPASPNAALAQAVDAFSILLTEGLITSELAKAYRFASDFALELGQHEKALQYAFYEGNIEGNILGKEIGDLRTLGLASEQWITSIQLRMDKDGVRMPGEKFWANFPEKKPMWYELRKMERKRAAEEKDPELAEQKQENYAREKAAKKIRDLAKRNAKLQESQQPQDQGEDKENVEADGAVGAVSE